MKILSGMLLLPFLFSKNNRGREKIDSSLLKKTRTLGLSKIPAIVFSKQGKTKVCDYLESKGVEIKYELPLINAYAVELDGDKLEDTAKSDIVEYISDDVKMTSLLNVAAQEVGARIANETGYTGDGIGIAVLDTGIYPHQDFTRPRNRIIAFQDFVNNRQNPYDDNGHGTFVAGVAAGSGYTSRGKYKGVAPGANLIGIKVMDENGSGNSSDILAGMQWVADHQKKFNIRIMSISLGAKPSDSRFDPLAAAVEAVWDKGVVVVAAAGNSGPRQNTIVTPGISPAIITVGAVDDKRTTDYRDDEVASFSSRGPTKGRQVKPDIVAPGVDIMSANTDKEYTGGIRPVAMKEPYTQMSGTSFATPIVSGAAALLLSKNPKMAPSELKESLMKSTFNMDGVNKYAQGSGILDIKKCLNLQ